MKKMSAISTTAVIVVILFFTLSLLQCTKTDSTITGPDRSYKGAADTTLYASFYDSVIVKPSDATPDVNDVIIKRGVRNIVKEYCATSSCHGGAIGSRLLTYSDIMRFVTPGNPDASKLWVYITTNNYTYAMPPINSNHDLNSTDKSVIYNWIKNGAKEYPDLTDFRPAAVRLIVDGCASVNCHSQATATGAWARKGWLGTLAVTDTTQYIFTNQSTLAQTNYCILSNTAILTSVWNAYKDSVRRFYADTLANASFKVFKTFSTRGPLASYDDLLLDIWYPKGVRSTTVINNYLNPSSVSTLVSRVDSTLLVANPTTGVYRTTQQGDMAYGDGGLKPSEVALIKAWYFADPNIPDVWKYGKSNAGIFKYRKTGNIIKQ